MMTVVFENSQGKLLSFTKGADESIIPLTKAVTE
jgi:magnesium-transporting ATPase (P-type)